MFDRSKKKSAETPIKERNSADSSTSAPPHSNVRNVAMIGPSIIIKGEVTGDEDILIEGRVEGVINLNSNQVSIGKSGDVSSDIRARVINIDGAVTGDLWAAEKVVISKSGNVSGNIVAPRVMLEDGAIFKGSIDMDPAAAIPADATLTSQQPANTAAAHMSSPGLDLKSV